MNFLGMGPWMMGTPRRQYDVASPRELLEAAQAHGRRVHPLPDDDGHVRPEARDMIDGMGEPAGAATVIELMTERRTPRSSSDQPRKEPSP